MNFFNTISEIRKWIVLALLGLVLFFGYKFFFGKKSSSSIEYDTSLIQQQIKNVGKLVVTEGHFAEVMTYKDKKETYVPGLSFDKKAIVVINADVTVGFDLSLVQYDVDEEKKTVTILSIPKEEIKISPDIKYYDIEFSSFNEFSPSDYNKISKIAKINLTKKIEKSSLKSNAKNRLLSELSKMLIVTNTLGWTLIYNGETINDKNEFKL
ncbi:DUF4230 domain-containing protein [Flavobacterium sp.]|uniref:DUF4230 domain-containing protein n=1 Tax=Flavobacterium sp. TaxID=239 RepID=UPI003D281F5C